MEHGRRERAPLGASPLMAPRMAVGTMSWGSTAMGYGRTHGFDDLYAAYRACLDAGFDFFDTAPMYGGGESERILGECRRRDGRPIVVATKFAPSVWYAPSSDRRTPASLMTGVEASLRRLDVETIDLLQLHMQPSARLLDGFTDALARAVGMGKVRAVGLCNFTAAAIRSVHGRLAAVGVPVASAMAGYNLIRRWPEVNGVIDTCGKLGVSFLAYAPLAEGVLTGKYRDGSIRPAPATRLLFRMEQLDVTCERGRSRPFARPVALDASALEPLFGAMKDVAERHGGTLGQVALAWLLCRDTPVIPVVGAKNPRQAAENLGAAAWRLERDEIERLDTTSAPLGLHGARKPA